MEEYGDEAAELRALRERAYGPEADIHDDPEALARLEELEASSAPERAEREVAAATEPPDGQDAAPSPREDARLSGDPAEIVLEDASSVPASAAPPGIAIRLWRWIPALWVASVLVAVGVAVTATTGWALVVFAPITRAPEGVRQYAVLTEGPSPAQTSLFGDTTIRSFGDFHGLTVLAPDISRWQQDIGECLFIMRTADYESGTDTPQGVMVTGCSAGEFPAVAQLVVTKDLPEAIHRLFTEGTGIEFVLDGNRVGVFVDR